MRESFPCEFPIKSADLFSMPPQPQMCSQMKHNQLPVKIKAEKGNKLCWVNEVESDIVWVLCLVICTYEAY